MSSIALEILDRHRGGLNLWSTLSHRNSLGESESVPLSPTCRVIVLENRKKHYVFKYCELLKRYINLINKYVKNKGYKLTEKKFKRLHQDISSISMGFKLKYSLYWDSSGIIHCLLYLYSLGSTEHILQ